MISDTPVVFKSQVTVLSDEKWRHILRNVRSTIICYMHPSELYNWHSLKCKNKNQCNELPEDLPSHNKHRMMKYIFYDRSNETNAKLWSILIIYIFIISVDANIQLPYMCRGCAMSRTAYHSILTKNIRIYIPIPLISVLLQRRTVSFIIVVLFYRCGVTSDEYFIIDEHTNCLVYREMRDE